MIRRAETDSDLSGLCEVWTAITPREPLTVDQLKRRLARQPERLYLVAEVDGGVVGCGLVARSDSPARIFVGVRILPEFRRHGIGSRLFDSCAIHARELQPEWISTMVSEADAQSVVWAERRGFEEYQRQAELILQVTGNERPPALLGGVEIIEVTPDLREAAYALTQEAWKDLPLEVLVEPSDFDVWLEEDMPGPIAFAAMEKGEMVGFAGLIERDAPGLLEHGLTATRRTHRRRGIATALKQTQIAWAAANGYRELMTFTQDRNEGMQALNLALGYEPQPDWISMRRRP